MLYVLADWVHGEDGYSPDLPDGCAFLCLAGSSRHAKFGLFQVNNLSNDEWQALRVRSVPPALATLLASAAQYPPALAGAVHTLESLEVGNREEFVSELQRLLRIRLEGQRFARHVLLRSRASEAGYREEGEYVWVVGYRPEAVGREVSWLASDYQVYSDAVGSFDVEPAWLAKRFGVADAEPGPSTDGEGM